MAADKLLLVFEKADASPSPLPALGTFVGGVLARTDSLGRLGPSQELQAALLL